MADEKENPEEEEGGKKKSKMMLIIIIAVVLLLGGGAAAYFLLMGDDEAASEEEAAEQVEEEAEPVELDPIYHEMETFIVHLMPTGKKKMLQMDATVYTHNQEVVDFLTANKPMVRHHLINILEGHDSNSLITLEGKQILQKELQDAIAEKMKAMNAKGEVKAIYFTKFVMQ